MTITDTTEGEHAAIAIDNGLMRFLVVPEYRGGIASWQERRADGRTVEHLHAARPAPGTFVWFNPWYGGLNPGIGGPGTRRSVRPLDEAQFAWEETTRDGAGGRTLARGPAHRRPGTRVVPRQPVAYFLSHAG